MLLTAFALQQRFSFWTTESERIFPVHFLANKEAVLLFVLSSALNAWGYIPLYYNTALLPIHQRRRCLERGSEAATAFISV